MTKLDGKSFAKVFDDYAKNQKWLNAVEVEIVGGENNVDPLLLLRIYEDKISVANNLELAQNFCLGKVVRFTRKGEVIKDVHYEDGSLSEYFRDAPYLLDVLLKASYALLLKKLTPPSEDSESNGEQ